MVEMVGDEGRPQPLPQLVALFHFEMLDLLPLWSSLGYLGHYFFITLWGLTTHSREGEL